MLEINHIFHIRGPKMLTTLPYPQPRLISSENVKMTYFRGLGFNIGLRHTYKLDVKVLEIYHIFPYPQFNNFDPSSLPPASLDFVRKCGNDIFQGAGVQHRGEAHIQIRCQNVGNQLYFPYLQSTNVDPSSLPPASLDFVRKCGNYIFQGAGVQHRGEAHIQIRCPNVGNQLYCPYP